MEIKHCDILIVGAGPSGAACALRLSKSGYKVVVLEKEVFPRDKTCGDALSPDVMNQLPMLSEELLADFHANIPKIPSHGVKIIAPDSNYLDLPSIYKGKKVHGFTCKRIDFDNLMFKHMSLSSNIDIIQDCKVNSVVRENGGVTVDTSKGIFKSKMVVGADGAKSVVVRNLAPVKLERKHYCVGLRIYYEGVTDFHPENYIELYLFNEILPGYLWVFQLPDNKANVGIGILASKLVKKKINLKETLTKLIETHPMLKERFKNATPLESIKGHGLPLGSRKHSISGERYLLTGDAAGLIDPLSGEGVGNALRSGRVAAEHIMQCIEKNDYSAAFNKKYDKEIYRRMWKEFKRSRSLQSLSNHSFLLNKIIQKAKRNIYFLEYIINAMSDIEYKNLLFNPVFYYRLMFNNKTIRLNPANSTLKSPSSLKSDPEA
jgi:geranylgeranyl reductase family protein